MAASTHETTSVATRRLARWAQQLSPTSTSCAGPASHHGIFYDRGAPVTGGWLAGAWASHDPVRGADLLWGGEMGQEGAVLFGVDATGRRGEVVEEHRVGCREFIVKVDHRSGTLWVLNLHGLRQPGHMLQSWSPQTRRLTPHGFPPISNQRFAGVVVALDGVVWCGTHPNGHLTSFHPSSGAWEDHGYLGLEEPAEVSPGVVQQIWCYPLGFTAAGEVVIRHNYVGKNIAFDPATRSARVISEREGSAELGVVSLPEVDAGGPSVDMQRFARPDPRDTFSYLSSDGLNCGVVSCCVDGVEVQTNYRPKVATDICGLNLGSDGKLYGCTIISMNLFCYDPATFALEDLGKVGWAGGEVYDVIAAGDKIYLGSYGGGIFAEFDPSKPWQPSRATEGTAADANPRSYGPLGDGMNRPFEYVVFEPDGQIYIACRANYGLPGGGLAIFDPMTKRKQVFRDELQSVQSIAADTDFVYCGTSIHGGRGCVDVTAEGRLFLWDAAKEQRAFECIPVRGAIAVTSLAVSKGLVVGSAASYNEASDNMIFVFDTFQRQVALTMGGWAVKSFSRRPVCLQYFVWRATEGIHRGYDNVFPAQVTHTFQLRSPGTPLAGVPEAHGVIHLTAASDGDVYGVSRDDIFKLDLSTLRIVYLDPPPIRDLYQIVEGPTAGVFYIGARGHLLEYHIKDTPHFR
jgi:hypothetical protein